MAETTTQKQTIWEDLVKLQANLPHIKKDATNPHFRSKYASLDGIHDEVLPIISKYNFAWMTFPSENESGEPSLKYALIHKSGDKLEGEMKLLVSKNDPQGQGSALTYARRYSICSVLGLTPDEDDDGNRASSSPFPQDVPERQVAVPATPAQITGIKNSLFKGMGITTKEDALLSIKLLAGIDIPEIDAEHLTKAQASAVMGKLVKTTGDDLKALIMDHHVEGVA